MELLVCVGIDADVQRKGIDAEGFCAFHVIVVVGWAVSVTDNADLSQTTTVNKFPIAMLGKLLSTNHKMSKNKPVGGLSLI